MIPYNHTSISTIQGKWTVQKVTTANQGGQWVASVRYECKDANNKTVDSFSIFYDGEEYNTWFTNYNTGTYLLEELKVAKQLTEEIEEDSESNFFNVAGSPNRLARRIIL